MNQYATYKELGANEGARVERCSIDIPSDLKEWKGLVKSHPIVLLYVWKQSCLPCVQIKNRYEEWLHSLRRKYRDDRGIMLFVKDCLDRDGGLPVEGTPSAVHNRMAQMVPFFILYYNNHIVFRHAGFEPAILEEYIDMCVSDLVTSTTPVQAPAPHGNPENVHIQYFDAQS